MDLSTIANVATALAVIIGLVFGMFEVLRARREREERASYEVVHAMITPEWINSINILLSADDFTVTKIEEDAGTRNAVWSVTVILETLGYAVFRRIVPLEIVDDLLGGAIRVSWRKLQPYIEHNRAVAGSQKSWEWFQWLAERIEEHGGRRTSLTRGANQAFKHWQP